MTLLYQVDGSWMVDQFIHVPVTAIVEKLPVRKLHAAGVARLRASLKARGFLDNYPITLIDLGNGTYRLVDGNHRLEAARLEEVTEVPALIKQDMEQIEAYRFAFQSNQASEAYVPNTLITYTEFVWARAEEGVSQDTIGQILGWSQPRVNQYQSLKKIGKLSWIAIITTFDGTLHVSNEGAVIENITPVIFTEYLLRSILDLRPCQQLELVQQLADATINKNKFKARAEAYATPGTDIIPKKQDTVHKGS